MLHSKLSGRQWGICLVDSAKSDRILFLYQGPSLKYLLKDLGVAYLAVSLFVDISIAIFLLQLLRRHKEQTRIRRYSSRSPHYHFALTRSLSQYDENDPATHALGRAKHGLVNSFRHLRSSHSKPPPPLVKSTELITDTCRAVRCYGWNGLLHSF